MFLAGFSVIGLASCSDETFQSALYNPYPEDTQSKQEITTVPSNVPSTAADDTSNPTTPTAGIKKPSQSRPKVQADPSARPNKSWVLKRVKANQLLGSLFTFLSESDIAALKDDIKLKVELRTIGTDEALGERYLEGILTIDVKNKDGIIHRKIMRNVETVIFRNEGPDDWMIAEFGIAEGLTLVLDLVRRASTTTEEAKKNAWAGILAISDSMDSPGAAPAIVAEISGFMAPLKDEE